MSSILARFSFDPSKIDGKIIAILVFIWLVVLACGIGSVLSHGSDFNRKQRSGWILLLVVAPVLGLLIYLPFSIKRDGFTVMRQTKGSKKTTVMVDSKTS
jgi:membrane protease YdiL (CAAX protease family)